MAAKTIADPSRLYTALLNTGLQTKNNPLYQVIYELIKSLDAVNSNTTTVISGGGGTPVVVDPPWVKWMLT